MRIPRVQCRALLALAATVFCPSLSDRRKGIVSAVPRLGARADIRPAGISASGELRTDEAPGYVAFGCRSEFGLRTDVLHLPVRGNGANGAVSTAADLAAFWSEAFDSRILPEQTFAVPIQLVSRVSEEHIRYGRGFWLGWESDMIELEGYDTGVSERPWRELKTRTAGTVIANISVGAWAVLRAIDRHRNGV